ncbi:hypothetical protein LCGC14_0421290 [marine sediment metagenome]|uniref:J domain-containing protein n=1 Tax=marine sediment metagenome TaxID=412755 RepID=A0A0F9T8V1_9ZZZZ
MSREEAIRILGLKGNPDKQHIKKAYKKKAHLLHPDKGGDAKSFSLVAEAYGLLTGRIKPRKRAIVIRQQPVQWVQVIFRYTTTTTNENPSQ